MKNILLCLPVIMFLASCQGGKNYSAKLENSVDSMSYVVGEALFRSFDNKGLNLKPTLVRQGYIEARDSSGYMDFQMTQSYIRKLEMELEVRQEAFTDTEQPVMNLDTIAYAMGADLGHRFISLDLDLNPDALFNGINDYASHGAQASRLPGPLYDAQYREYEKWVNNAARYKRAQLATKNLAQSEAFFRAMVKEDGVIARESGLMYRILQKGSGKIPQKGDSVAVRYQGRLITGEVFDETTEGETADFLLQESFILPGWLEALTMMPIGSKWQLYLPPTLAYGSRGFYDIEPNTALEFDVELVAIK